MIAVPPITLNAWLDDGSIEWIKRAFPSEIEDILLTDEFDANDYEYMEVNVKVMMKNDWIDVHVPVLLEKC